MKVLHQQWFTEGNQGRPIGIIVFMTEAGRRIIKIGTGGGLDPDNRQKDIDMIQRLGVEVSPAKLQAILALVL